MGDLSQTCLNYLVRMAQQQPGQDGLAASWLDQEVSTLPIQSTEPERGGVGGAVMQNLQEDYLRKDFSLCLFVFTLIYLHICAKEVGDKLRNKAKDNILPICNIHTLPFCPFIVFFGIDFFIFSLLSHVRTSKYMQLFPINLSNHNV